ncbi:MAG TPA: hypothetical protein VNI78_12905 [Vicinamibacterales bacterium]|nr:hypothetical protein [Vicinamibacterales bacterium]
MIRCAFAHDMVHPHWEARGPYVRVLQIELASVAQGIASAIAFFIFFAAMFNDLSALMLASGATGLVANFVVPLRIARRSRSAATGGRSA